MGNRTDYFRQYSRERRAKLRKQGICPVCSSRKLKQGYRTCGVCIKKANERGQKAEVIAIA